MATKKKTAAAAIAAAAATPTAPAETPAAAVEVTAAATIAATTPTPEAPAEPTPATPPAPAPTPPAATKPAASKLDTLYKPLGQIGVQIRDEAERAYRDFLAQLPRLKLTLEEAGDVQWATHQLAAAGVLSIGASTDAERRQVNKLRADATSILADVRAIKTIDAGRLLQVLVARIFARVQDVILGYLTLPVAPAVAGTIGTAAGQRAAA